MESETLRTIGFVILGTMAVSLVIAALLFASVVRQIKQLNIPPDATFNETLRQVPFTLVLFLDLLDLGLDVLAAPVSWVLLDRLGLKALRNVSAVEALFPFTQPIPTLTLCWLGVRLFPKN